MARPERTIAEAIHASTSAGENARLVELARELERVEGKQKRLAELYLAGTLPAEILDQQAAELAAQRRRLERERATIAPPREPIDVEELRRNVPAVAAFVRSWVLNATEENVARLLIETRLQIFGTAERAEVVGNPPPTPALVAEGAGVPLPVG